MSVNAQPILLVEDSSTSRVMSTLLLEEAGYKIVGCESAEQAMGEMRRHRFALLILDQELPGMSGLDFLIAARAIQPDVPAIFVAGSLDLNLAVRISQQRVAGIFTKPVDPRTLLRKVADAVHAPGSEKTSDAPNETSRQTTNVPFLEVNPVSRPRGAHGQAAPTARSIVDACEPYSQLGQRLTKVSDFRSILLLQGPSGAPFRLVAKHLVETSAFSEGPFLECSREEFELPLLLQSLASLLVAKSAGTLLLTGVEDFTSDQIALLADLLKCRGPFMPFAQRFRVIVGATPRLAQLAEDGKFDENLYYRISSLLINVPALEDIRDDIVALARFLLEEEQLRSNADVPVFISPDAANWLEDREWQQDFDELQRIVTQAARLQTGAELTVEALETAIGQREAATPATPAPARRNPEGSATRHLHPILVLDDSSVPRETTELALRSAGFDVVSYGSGEQALQDIKGRRFSLLILDYELPGMSGFEFLTAARAYHPEIPAIFVAGSLNLNVAAEITRLSVAGIFTKPVDLRVLVSKVTEIVGKKRFAAPPPMLPPVLRPITAPAAPQPAAPATASAAPAATESSATNAPFRARPKLRPEHELPPPPDLPPALRSLNPHHTPARASNPPFGLPPKDTLPPFVVPKATAPTAAPAAIPSTSSATPVVPAPRPSTTPPVAATPSPAPIAPPATPAKPTPPAPPAPRPLVRKQPGSYDFNSRLQSALEQKPAPRDQ